MVDLTTGEEYAARPYERLVVSDHVVVDEEVGVYVVADLQGEGQQGGRQPHVRHESRDVGNIATATGRSASVNSDEVQS